MKQCRRCGLTWPLSKLQRVITPQHADGMLVCKDDRYCFPSIRRADRRKLAVFLTAGKRSYFPTL